MPATSPGRLQRTSGTEQDRAPRSDAAAGDPGVDLGRHFRAMLAGWWIWSTVGVLIGLLTFVMTNRVPVSHEFSGSIRVGVTASGTAALAPMTQQVATVAMSDAVANSVAPSGSLIGKVDTQPGEDGLVTVTLRSDSARTAVDQVNKVMQQTVRTVAGDRGTATDNLSDRLRRTANQVASGQPTAATRNLRTLAAELDSNDVTSVTILDKAAVSPDSANPRPLQNSLFAGIAAALVAAELTSLYLTRRPRRRD